MKTLVETILSRELHDPKAAIYNWLDEHGIKNYTLNDKGEIDVDGDVDLRKKGLKEFPSFIQFGVVKGFFDCSYNNLTSLKGAPDKIKGYFDCRSNNLESLEGAPKEVEKYFICCTNKLTTLVGAPERVGWSFDCSHNNLTTLEGAPRKIGGAFFCNSNKTQFTEDDVRRVCKVKHEISIHV